MVFIKEYTFSDIINSIILFFTLVGIILTFFTLLEMKKQRKISIIPKLILYIDDEDMFGIHISNKVKDDDKYNENLRFKIKNVGNGSANWIQINYHINDEIIDLRWCTKWENNTVIVDTKKHTSDVFDLQRSNKRIYSTIPSNGDLSVNPEEVTQIIYTMMCIYLKNDNKKLYSIKNILDISISYYDVIGNKYKSKFFININKINSDENDGVYISHNITLK